LFNLWFSLLVIAAAGAATMRIPIRGVSWLIFISSICIAVVAGILEIGSRRRRQRLFMCFFLAVPIVLTVTAVDWSSLARGQFVSIFQDAWAYSALGAHLRNPISGFPGSQDLIQQFGESLMSTRFGTAGLLALSAEISGTDTCRSAAIFAFLVLLQAGFGIALFTRILGAGPMLSICAGVFAVAFGWLVEILKIGNWDQFLFISFVPFILTRLRLLTLPTSGRWALVPAGLCLSAATYSYPEGMAIFAVLFAPCLAMRFIRGLNVSRKVGRAIAVGGIVLAVCSIYWPTFVSFLWRQIGAGTGILVAKGVFPGLLSDRWLPAFYGLGEELPNAKWSLFGMAVALSFLFLTAVAFFCWRRRKLGMEFSLLGLLLLAFWQLGLLKYDYGFYKILTIFWPVIIAAIFVGGSRMLGYFGGPMRFIIGCFVLGVFAGAGIKRVENSNYPLWRTHRSTEPFVNLAEVRPIVQGRPIRLTVDDWFDQEWAYFFLEGLDIRIPDPATHLQYLNSPALGWKQYQDAQPSEEFVLTERSHGNIVWRNKIFRLANQADPAEILAVNGPSKLGRYQGYPFLWLENVPTTLVVFSKREGEFELTADRCLPGPSRPNDLRRTLVVQTGSTTEEFVASSPLSVRFNAAKGINLLKLSCKEPATTHKLPFAGTGILLIGMKNFQLKGFDESR
jgi:hypothetical protein